MEPILDIDEEMELLMQRSYVDSSVAAKVFYPERFRRPYDPLHRQIFEKIDNSTSNYIAIAAPRGIGKTSVANLVVPTKAALFHEARYIVPISATSDLAMQQSENLKRSMTSSTAIKSVWGDLRISDEDVGPSTFSKKQWVINVAGREVCIMPRGAGQQVRGLLWRDYRPDLVVVDDLEDPENMDNEDQRKKKKDWFYEDLMGCFELGSPDFKLIFVGTVLHQDSLLVNLLDDPMWDSLRLEICDDDFVSNAPNTMDDAACLAKYEFYKSIGQAHSFFREYRNLPVPRGDDAAFQESYFQSYVTADRGYLKRSPDVERVCLVDIAKTANPSSAESAFVHIDVDLKNQAFFVSDIAHGRWHWDRFFDELIDSLKRNNTTVLGVEVTSLHEFITYPLKNELARNNLHHIEFIPLHARGGRDEKGKIARVRSLIPFYRRGQMFHNPACCAPLESQLLSFPAARRWDIMDALGYLPEVLEVGNRFMKPFGEADFEDTAESREEVEREFAELMEGDYYWDPITNYGLI